MTGPAENEEKELLRELATVAVGLQNDEVERVQMDIAWERRFRRGPLRPTYHHLAPMRWATFAGSQAPWDEPEDYRIFCVSELGLLGELLSDSHRHKRVVRFLTLEERRAREDFLRDGLWALACSSGEPISDSYWINLYR